MYDAYYVKQVNYVISFKYDASFSGCLCDEETLRIANCNVT